MMPISAALRGGVCLALYALAAACGGSAIPIAGGIVDRSYAHKRLLWQNGLAGLVTALKANEEAGMVALWGAYAELPGVIYAELTDQVVRRASQEIAGDLMMNNLDWFQSHAARKTLSCASAYCFQIDKPWEARFGRERVVANFQAYGYIVNS